MRELPELLRPAIEKYRDETDRLGRLPVGLTEELRAAGAFRLYTPREFGGFEAPMAEFLDVIERFARVDGAVAWTIWNLNMGMNAAFLPEAGAAEIWTGGPDPLIAHNPGPTGRAEPVPGGYRLTGTWKVVSGAHTAEWFMLGALAGEELIFAVVPRSAVTVHETWDTVALRGTDSNAVEADGVEVPASRVWTVFSESTIDRPLYRMPRVTLFVPGIAAVLLGMVKAAVDETAAYVAGNPAVAARPRAQAAVGRATAQVTAARLLLVDAAAAIDAAARSDRAVTDALRGALRGAVCLAGETAREVILSMHELGGSGVLNTGSRLGRILRDALATTQHINLRAENYELAGRARLGLPADTPTL